VEPDGRNEAIAEGRSALARGAWAKARALFAEALARAETPEAYEGLGIAARYELDAEAAIEAHEHGFRLARTLGDAAAAAELAIQLSYDAGRLPLARIARVGSALGSLLALVRSGALRRFPGLPSASQAQHYPPARHGQPGSRHGQRRECLLDRHTADMRDHAPLPYASW
jgi:hypothetical protein